MTPEQMDKIKFCKGMQFVHLQSGFKRELMAVDFENYKLYCQDRFSFLIYDVSQILNPDGTEVEV